MPSFSRLAENWCLKHIRKKTQNHWDDIFADAHLSSNHTPQEFSALLFLKTIRIKNSRARQWALRKDAARFLDTDRQRL